MPLRTGFSPSQYGISAQPRMSSTSKSVRLPGSGLPQSCYWPMAQATLIIAEKLQKTGKP